MSVLRFMIMSHKTDDLRIAWTKVLLPPAFLEEEIPASENVSDFVDKARREICSILRGDANRILVIVGPCSIHDVAAAREYAGLLKSTMAEVSADLCLVMRVYFEKPRTTVGWKGLINDPHLDQTFKVNEGLRLARHLLVDLAEMGVPAGTEFLDLVTPQYLADLVSWGAIGARTTESQAHRQLVSGLSCPTGFKNGTSGDVQIAIQAIKSAAHPHCFLGHTKYGQSAIFGTSGNQDCHIILRGGGTTVNYTAECVDLVSKQLSAAGLTPHLMIDCSHANSQKDHTKQPFVCRDVAAQIAGGDNRIVGVMLESNLVAGSQKLIAGRDLRYGQSITDSCMAWDETLTLLRDLAQAVQARRITTQARMQAIGSAIPNVSLCRRGGA
jgi:3-deoxy-7-phosphoheptulonate synthase